MGSSSNDADWVDVAMPTPEIKRLRINDTEPTDATSLHETIKKNALSLLNDHPKSPIFHVDFDHSSGSLSDVYEQSYPASLRQEFTCITCRKFIRRFGDLALVDEHTGALLPLFWNPQNHIDPFLGPVSVVSKRFVGRKVTKEFKVILSQQNAGIEECGGWTHMSFDFPSTRITLENLPGLSTASTPELAAMLTQVLKDYNLDTVRRASQLLLEDKLSYADSHKASIRWLLTLKENHFKEQGVDEVAKHNLLYCTAASSFLGCLKQLRSGAVGTLLSDVKDKKSFEDIQGSWNQITNPTNYMRPTATPSAGNIAVAERLFDSLGLTQGDMRREYLTPCGIPEAVYIFRDRHYDPLPMPKECIFSHIVPKTALKKLPKQDGSNDIPNRDPPTTMSFTTFAKKVLPTAAKMEYQLPREIYPYFFITGLPGTKPLMQWHGDTNRVSWYTHSTTIHPSACGLGSGWKSVRYIIPFPHLWDAPAAATTFPLSEDPAAFKYYHFKQGFRYLIGLEGIKDPRDSELCLFPTLLKSEFHGVRSTIERYSKMGKIERTAGWVGGVEMSKSTADKKHLFRVMDQKGQQGTYEILLFE